MTQPLKILSIEDEPIIARRVKRLCREILGKQMASFQHVASLELGQAALVNDKVDLVLLDLNLNGEDGFSLLREFTSYPAQTIIISAYADKAIEAFEYGVVDFVAKPIGKERLEKALSRASQRIAGQRIDKTARFLSFRTGRRTEIVPVEEIAYLKGADKYSEVISIDKTVRLHDKTLSQLEAMLPANFVRSHRSYIVPKERIAQIQTSPGSKYELVLLSGEYLPIGRTRLAQIREHLDAST